MIVIKKEDIEYYRYAIAKICFIKCYPEYHLIHDITKSNCMIVSKEVNKGHTKSYVISLFSSPTMDMNNLDNIDSIVYYQKRHFAKVVKNHINHEKEDIKQLSDEFDDQYNRDLKYAVLYSERYTEKLDANYLIFFNGIIIDSSKFKNKSCYKYYSTCALIENKHGTSDGNVSLTNPYLFNDPFDVNCHFANGKDMSSLFRILCVTKDYNEILMWSYYASEHKGFCIEYCLSDIISAIQKLEYNGICMFGDVNYEKIRPNQKSKLNNISITELQFYRKASFTKFQEWKHEREMRFVMISPDFSNNENLSDFIQITVPVKTVYQGCCGKNCSIVDSNGQKIPYIKLNKDSVEYDIY